MIKVSQNERWEHCQKKLTEWRNQYPITNEMAMPSYDHSAQLISQYSHRDDNFIDIGCKTGGLRQSKYFPKSVNYYGVDPLCIEGEEYLFNFKNCKIEEAVEVYGREFFHCAHIKDSIDYFCDLDTSLQSIIDILKPGGIIIITEGDFQPVSISGYFIFCLRRIRQFLNDKYVHAHDTYPNGDYSLDCIKTSIIRSGLSIIFEEINDGRLDLVIRKNIQNHNPIEET